MLSLLALLLFSSPEAQATAAANDVELPVIMDVAAAASSPSAAPIITAMVADRGSGVGAAVVVFRPTGGAEWQRVDLKPGNRGLFIARLPDGLQTTGFAYYVEATDIAGNGPARIGSPESPIQVPQATEPTLARMARTRFVEPGPSIHPGWLMLSLGTGVATGAGAGVFALDLANTNGRLTEVNQLLASSSLSNEQRALQVKLQRELEAAVVSDTVIVTVLGVVAAASLVTGGTLVVLSSME